MNSLTLSMIVRDASAFLPSCLESVRGIAGEIVIADTGSTDDSIAIAQSFGARVISIPWSNDFAEARNRALAETKSDWVLSLDADEQLDPQAAQQIPGLLKNSSIAGYQVTIRNYVLSLQDRVWDRTAIANDFSLEAAKPYPAYVEHENVRLFRRDPEIYFVGRVHESVGPRILETKRGLDQAPFLIHHFGMVADEETRARKNRFYRELGRQKIKEMPKNAQAHLELGLVELDNFGNLAEARRLFERACKLNPRFSQAWFFQGITLLKLEHHAEALRCLAEAERLGHRTALVAETRGDAHYNLGHFAQAEQCYETALHRDPQNTSLESKLGIAAVRAGKIARGIQCLRHAVSSHQALPESHDHLVLALVSLDDLPEAAKAAENKLRAIANPTAGDFLRAASLAAKLRDWQRALSILEQGLEKYPSEPRLQQGFEEATRSANQHDLVNTLNT